MHTHTHTHTQDGNGVLTYDELYESLLSMPGLQSIPREKLDELYERMDEEGAEGVSQDDFISMFQEIATKVHTHTHINI